MAMDRARDVLSAEYTAFSGKIPIVIAKNDYLLSAEQLCISLTLFRGFVPSISAHSSHTYNTHKPLCLSEKTMLKKLSAVNQNIQQLIGCHSLSLRLLWRGRGWAQSRDKL
ncbi:MAG: hypothetical protein WBF55_05990 [Syntrophobacteria bacterium]